MLILTQRMQKLIKADHAAGRVNMDRGDVRVAYGGVKEPEASMPMLW